MFGDGMPDLLHQVLAFIVALITGLIQRGTLVICIFGVILAIVVVPDWPMYNTQHLEFSGGEERNPDLSVKGIIGRITRLLKNTPKRPQEAIRKGKQQKTR